MLTTIRVTCELFKRVICESQTVILKLKEKQKNIPKTTSNIDSRPILIKAKTCLSINLSKGH